MVSLRQHFVPNPVSFTHTRFRTKCNPPLLIHTRYDINGNLIPGTGERVADDDFLIVKVTVYDDMGQQFADPRETIRWYPHGDVFGGGYSYTDKVHAARSEKLHVDKPTKGVVKIELIYADGNREYGTVTIAFDFTSHAGFGEPKVS